LEGGSAGERLAELDRACLGRFLNTKNYYPPGRRTASFRIRRRNASRHFARHRCIVAAFWRMLDCFGPGKHRWRGRLVILETAAANRWKIIHHG
jgi:hypothetical protein